MNKKAQTAPASVAIIVAIFIFLVGMVTINILKPDITIVRSAASGINCDNSAAISDGTKMTCLVIDLVVPGFMIAIFSLIGGLITFKIIK